MLTRESEIRDYCEYITISNDLCLIKRFYYNFSDKSINIKWVDLSFVNKDEKMQKIGYIIPNSKENPSDYVYDSNWFITYHKTEKDDLIADELFSIVDFKDHKHMEYQLSKKDITSTLKKMVENIKDN